MEFPRTAVICAPTKEDAEILRDIFVSHGFIDSKTDDPFTESSDMEWEQNGVNTCYDITDNKTVYSAARHYYETRFEDEYPELFPDDPCWFLCSVQDFIAMCSDGSFNAEFEVAEECDLEVMLGG